VTIFLCFALPSFILFLIWHIFSETFSLDVKTLVRHLGLVPMMTSSVVNPLIYTVRKKQFRVAFIEFPLRKSSQVAAGMVGSRNNVVGPRNGQEREEQEQKVENEKSFHVNHSNEHDSEVNVCGVDFDDKNTSATQDRPVSLNAFNSTSKKNMEPTWRWKKSCLR